MKPLVEGVEPGSSLLQHKKSDVIRDTPCLIQVSPDKIPLFIINLMSGNSKESGLQTSFSRPWPPVPTRKV